MEQGWISNAFCLMKETRIGDLIYMTFLKQQMRKQQMRKEISGCQDMGLEKQATTRWHERIVTTLLYFYSDSFTVNAFVKTQEKVTSTLCKFHLNKPDMREKNLLSSTSEDIFFEEEMATHSSIPARKISWTEEPGGPQSGVAKSQTWLNNWAHTRY